MNRRTFWTTASLKALVFLILISSRTAQGAPRVVHVFVALADNQNQGIVPVPVALGNGNDPARNLYWGAAFGLKSFFKASRDWELVEGGRGGSTAVLERCVFRHRTEDVLLVADAYQGSRIRDAVIDFLSAAAGLGAESIKVREPSEALSVSAGGASDLIVYIGHDAFMDFQLSAIHGEKGTKERQVIVLACASKAFFGPYLRGSGSTPLLWTTGLMAPEAYTLKAALDGWISHEDHEAIRQSAARAYDKYQKCGDRAALRLFASGW